MWDGGIHEHVKLLLGLCIIIENFARNVDYLDHLPIINALLGFYSIYFELDKIEFLVIFTQIEGKRFVIKLF